MRTSRRRPAILGAALLLATTAVLGCTPPTPTPSAASSTTSPPTTAPTFTPVPSASPSTPPAVSFVWAARPEAFPGEDGASLTSLAVGPNGLIGLSVRNPDDGGPAMRLWGSTDGMTWQSIKPTGLPDRVYISGLWGAAGLYWLRGSLPDSEDPGILYRSSDGLTWRPSRSLTSDVFELSVSDGCEPSTVARNACPVFLTGTKDVDGAIWRSTDGGDSWAKATVDDATGWKTTQDAAPVSILGVIATSDGLLAFGNGLARASDTGGYLQARFWRSTDGGATWSRVPNTAPLGELLVRDITFADHGVVAVGEGVADQIAVVLRSTDGGRTWARAATSGIAADGNLSQVLIGGDGYVGLGFANPAAVDDFPLHESVWTSVDGASWSTGPAGDLEGGIVDDAVRLGDLIIAVGRAWTTDVTGTWEAPFGPGVWRLAP